MTGTKRWEKQLYGLREKEGERAHGPPAAPMLKPFSHRVAFGRSRPRWQEPWLYCFPLVPSKVALDSGWRPVGPSPLTTFPVACGV